jgi:hypothetical protein
MNSYESLECAYLYKVKGGKLGKIFKYMNVCSLKAVGPR